MFYKKTPLLIYVTLSTILLLINVKTYAQNTWQQKIDYQINVRLNDSAHLLLGDIRMVYHNQSNSALSEIWMHIWPNAYKNDKSAFAIQQLENQSTSFHYADENKRGYIDSLNFLVNGFKVRVVENENFPDILKLTLNQALLPGDSIIISSPFRVKLPNSYSRLGHVDQSYQISQWYPKPAVFDYAGWHPIPYLDQGEFYSEYGSFDVKITLPSNYIVGATGELQNEEEKLFLEALSESTKKIKVFSESDTFPKSSTTYKTLHYKQNNIHDFAWFADKRFHVLSSEVVLPYSKRKVKTFIMFTNAQSEYWVDAIKYINDAVYYYSLWIGEYPYNYCTAVDGALSAGGGMEYPMVTVVSEVTSAKTLDRILTHEVGHNWFYGILGSNEREYGWMDEGINSFYENRYMAMKYSDGKMLPKDKRNIFTKIIGLDYFPTGYDVYLTHQITASQGKAQAIATHSEEFTPINYGAIMYIKTSLVFIYLEQYLGVEEFDRIMQIYFAEWKFKHPQPLDIQYVFERESGQKLDWFFKDILENKNDIDFKISEIKKENNQLRVKITNDTEIAGPALIASFDKNGKTLESYKTQAFYGSIFVYFDSTQAKKIVVDPYYTIPETNRNNNTVKVNGLLKKVEPLRLQVFGGITRPDKTNLFISPAVGYNTSDGLMAGLAFYNNLYPFKNIEWAVAPMYGFDSKKLNGTGQVTHYSYPQKVQEIATRFSFNSFSDLNKNNTFIGASYYMRFLKLALGTEVTLKPVSPRSKIKDKIGYRFVFTQELQESESMYGGFGTKISTLFPNSYHQFKYSHLNSKVINPNSFYVMYEYANNLVNLYSISQLGLGGVNKETHHKLFAVFKQKFNYRESRKGLQLRAFAGTIFSNANRTNSSSFFSLSGNNDYTFDKAFFDRYNVNRNQMHELDGALKSNTFSGTVRTLIGLNLKAPLKSRIPIGVFADAAYSNEYQKLSGMVLDYDFGLYLPLVNDVIEVYFPLVYNQRLIQTNNYKEVIRFMIDFQTLQPLNLRRSLQLL